MYDLQSQFCNPMGFVPASREEFFNGSGYSFLNIGFGIKPHKEYEYIIKETDLNFRKELSYLLGNLFVMLHIRYNILISFLFWI